MLECHYTVARHIASKQTVHYITYRYDCLANFLKTGQHAPISTPGTTYVQFFLLLFDTLESSENGPLSNVISVLFVSEVSGDSPSRTGDGGNSSGDLSALESHSLLGCGVLELENVAVIGPWYDIVFVVSTDVEMEILLGDAVFCSVVDGDFWGLSGMIDSSSALSTTWAVS